MYLKPDTPAEKLKAYSQHEDWEVRLAAAGHPNCDMSTYDLLSRDTDTDVRKAVAENPSVDELILKKMLLKENSEIKQAALNNLNNRNPKKDWLLEACSEELFSDLIHYEEKLVNDITRLDDAGLYSFVSQTYPQLDQAQIKTLRDDMKTSLQKLTQEETKTNDIDWEQEIVLNSLDELDELEL